MENKPRYAIVRVGKGGSCVEEFICSGNCNKCDYGDTKEQLVHKIAQILFKEKIKHFIKTFNKIYLDKKWKRVYLKEALKEARKIVEFLGVQ